ncbi:MAG: hypothetical protein AXA67_03650 [Methylothermaceae bacteria B42]|nr:MAG: hypothetical protein AXA67_03650 [Methylothermaceae bacteria B42]
MSVPPVPAIGVSALVFDAHNRVLLIRRARPPAQGKWHAPGGRLEPGESLCHAVVREVKEETGIENIQLGPVIAVVERRIEGFHYLIVDFLAVLAHGPAPLPIPGDDALEAEWVAESEWKSYALAEGLLPILNAAVNLRRSGKGGLLDVDGRGTDFVAAV